MVDFTCLPEGRTATGYADTVEGLYVKRAMRGEILPELRDDATVNICFYLKSEKLNIETMAKPGN
jgi:hypothetical protein